MEISLEQLENLLNEQKKIVIERLLGSTSYYNSTNTPSASSSLPIDKEKFTETGISARMPRDIEILKNYNVK